MEASNWTTIIVNILQAITAIVVAWVAVWGVNAWRREHLGRRRAELAEETLALFYEAKNAIRAIRSIFGITDEGKTRKRDENETEDEAYILDTAYVIIERYLKRSELFARIHAMRYRFMALFGKEKAKPFEELREIVNEFYIARDGYVLSMKALRAMPNAAPAQQERFIEIKEKAESVFWEGVPQALGKPDPINDKLNAIIESIEKTCRDAIGAR